MLAKLQKTYEYTKKNSPFYREKFKTYAPVSSMEEFERLPFSDKAELRLAYPLGLLSVPQHEVVRVHSSSGTTGSPVIMPYTKRDVEDWAVQFARCYETAGVTVDSRHRFSGRCGAVGGAGDPNGPG